jgi:hypothetical protein
VRAEYRIQLVEAFGRVRYAQGLSQVYGRRYLIGDLFVASLWRQRGAAA